MGKLKDNARLIVQLSSAALQNGYLKGFKNGEIFIGKSKMFCVPGLNCYSCPGALMSCPLGALQNTLASSDYKLAFYALGIIMFFGAIFGRFVCGFLCPFGLIQDLLYRIPFFKKFRRLPGEKYLRFLRYVILAVFVIILPMFVVNIIGYGSPWFCKYICPAGTLEAGIPLALSNSMIRDAVGTLYRYKVIILVVTIIASIIVYRPFCRYICPLGAMYGVFNPVAMVRLKVDNTKCTKCKECQNACNMDIKAFEKPNSIDCIRCGKCVAVCPEKAIQWTALPKHKDENTEKSQHD